MRLLERPVAPRTCAVWERDGDAGYVVYELKRSTTASRLDATCTIHDWAWKVSDAREALLSYLANHAGQVGRIELRVSVDDPLTNLGGEGVEKVPARCPMVRLVDLALYDSREARGEAGALSFGVHDPLCPWNNGCYRLGVADEGPSPGSIDSPSLETDIATLSSLLWGSVSVETARRCGLIRGADSTAVDLLGSLVPRSPPFFLDWF
jgi:predicted acetyltransferase